MQENERRSRNGPRKQNPSLVLSLPWFGSPCFGLSFVVVASVAETLLAVVVVMIEDVVLVVAVAIAVADDDAFRVR